MKLNYLPKDVLLEVYSWLDASDVLSCRATCHLVKKYTQEKKLWMDLLARRTFLFAKDNFNTTEFDVFYERQYRYMYLKYQSIVRVKLQAFDLYLRASKYKWRLHGGITHSCRVFTAQCGIGELCIKVDSIFPVSSQCVIPLLENSSKHHLFEHEMLCQTKLFQVDASTEYVMRQYPSIYLNLLHYMVYDQEGTFHLVQHTLKESYAEDMDDIVEMSGYSVKTLTENTCLVSSTLQLRAERTHLAFLCELRALLISRLLRSVSS